MGVFRTFDRVKKWLDFRIHTRRQPTKTNIQPIYKLRFAMVAKIYNPEKTRFQLLTKANFFRFRQNPTFFTPYSPLESP